MNAFQGWSGIGCVSPIHGRGKTLLRSAEPEDGVYHGRKELLCGRETGG